MSIASPHAVRQADNCTQDANLANMMTTAKHIPVSSSNAASEGFMCLCMVKAVRRHAKTQTVIKLTCFRQQLPVKANTRLVPQQALLPGLATAEGKVRDGRIAGVSADPVSGATGSRNRA